jgi:predicted Ser/Thr protein kinase
MADLSITVKYRPPSKPSDWVRIALFCLAWCGLGVIAIAAHLPWLSDVYQHHVLVGWAILVGFYVYFYFPISVIAGKLKESNLFINASGMLMPPWLGIGQHRQVLWNELRSVDIDSSRCVRLTTTSGKRIKLDNTRIGGAELEKALLAIEVFSPTTRWSERSLEFKDSLQNTANGDALTFTQMWDEELRRHFQATTFVPHNPGSKLRAGTLTILRQLAFGGFSAVYLVEDRDPREKLILKEHVIRSTDADSQDKAKQMFDREAKILGSLSHSNIARVVDHFTEQDRSYLLIEFVDGENLRTFVRRSGPMSEARTVPLALEMIDILSYLHQRQPPIIHRDFTPDNLILSPSGKITLVDFGTANEYIAQATGTLVGKQSYMPIEQVRGKAEPRSDLYALGCTLYFLLTGKDPQPLSVCHTSAENHSISDGLDEIITRLTQTEPEGRYPNCESVKDSLRALTDSTHQCSSA